MALNLLSNINSYDIGSTFIPTDNITFSSEALRTPVGDVAHNVNLAANVNTINQGQTSPLADGMGSVLTMAGLAGIKGYFGAQEEKDNYRAMASNYDYQAKIADLNARASKLNIANAYKSSEYQAMQQGLADAQRISRTRTRTAGRGVQLNSGSAAELETTQRMNAELNQQAIRKNRVEAVNQQRLNLASAQGQGIVNRANAQAARDIAGTINPFLRGLGSFLTMGLMTDISWQQRGLGSPTINTYNNFFKRGQ